MLLILDMIASYISWLAGLPISYVDLHMTQAAYLTSFSSVRALDSLCTSDQSSREGQVDKMVFSIHTEGKN